MFSLKILNKDGVSLFKQNLKVCAYLLSPVEITKEYVKFIFDGGNIFYSEPIIGSYLDKDIVVYKSERFSYVIESLTA